MRDIPAVVDATDPHGYRRAVRSRAIVATYLIGAIACRAVWVMAAIAFAETGHGLTLGWQSGHPVLVLLHDADHGTAGHHRHGSADRLLLVADGHADEAPHHVSAFLGTDSGVASRADLVATTTISEATSVASSTAFYGFRSIRSQAPRSPPVVSAGLSPPLTNVLLI